MAGTGNALNINSTGIPFFNSATGLFSPLPIPGWAFIDQYVPSGGAVTIPWPSTPAYVCLQGFNLFPSNQEQVYLRVSMDGMNYETIDYYAAVNEWEVSANTFTNANSTSQFPIGTHVHEPGQGYGIAFNLLCGQPGGEPGGAFIMYGNTNYGDLSHSDWVNGLVNGVWDGDASPVSIQITSSSGLVDFGSVFVYAQRISV